MCKYCNQVYHDKSIRLSPTESYSLKEDTKRKVIQYTPLEKKLFHEEQISIVPLTRQYRFVPPQMDQLFSRL